MEALVRDVHLACRSLWNRPGYTLAAALTLALGIGVNTAVFSAVDAVLVRPLSYPEPERLVDLLATHPSRGPDRVGVTPADFLAWRDGSTVFAHLGAYVPFGTLDLTGAGEPVRLTLHRVSDGLLAALALRAEHGRLFAAEEYRDPGRRAVLLNHRLWRSRFGADSGIVGRTLTLDGEPYEVVGVLPAGLRLRGGDPDVLVPLVLGAEAAADRESAYLGLIGRLAPGVTLEQARAEMDTLSKDDRDLEASLLPLREAFVQNVRPALLALFGAVGFVLLIACVNVAHLQLARAAAQEPEVVLRAVLGADARRLARQLLTESLVLAAVGGALGVLVAALALRLFPDVRGLYLPRETEIGLDLRVLGFTLASSLLAGLLAGLLPALRVIRIDLRGLLQSGGVVGRSGDRRRWQDLLVVSEVALAFMLLAGAAFMVRGFARLLAEDPGFDPERVLTLEVSLPAARYSEPERVAVFYRDLLQHIEALPGVAAAGAAREIPPEGSWSFQPEVEGVDLPEDAAAGWQVVTPGYFAAMATPVLRGREVAAEDRPQGRLVMVANETAARRFFPAGDPLGRRVRFNGVWHEVVGVVRDQKAPGTPGGPAPVFYVAHGQTPVPVDHLRSLFLVIRTEGDPLALAAAVCREVGALDGKLPVSRLQTLEERLSRGTALARSRFHTALFATFAGLALLLAAVGIYGTLSYLVSRRTQELGIRMAVGADRADLLRLVFGRGLLLVAAGLALGLWGTLGLTRVLSNLLAGVGGAEPGPLAAAALALLAVASLACYLPAHRAGGLDPLAALRSE